MIKHETHGVAFVATSSGVQIEMEDADMARCIPWEQWDRINLITAAERKLLPPTNSSTGEDDNG